MPEFFWLYELAGRLPFVCMEEEFMRRALVALALLGPMAAVLGVQVVNFRMAFFSDAISHSAFTGVALGIMMGVHPHLAMPLFGLLVGLGIMVVKRRSSLPSDTVIAVFFAGLTAFGLALVSRETFMAGGIRQFLYGDILLLTRYDVSLLVCLFLGLMFFQVVAYNRLLYIGVCSSVAAAHGVAAAACQYIFAAMLALVAMFSVWSMGVLLVTALLVVPAAAARNLAQSAGGMFWWAFFIGLFSAVTGLVLSAQEWMNTATGATVILVACAWFVFSLFVVGVRRVQGE